MEEKLKWQYEEEKEDFLHGQQKKYDQTIRKFEQETKFWKKKCEEQEELFQDIVHRDGGIDA